MIRTAVLLTTYNRPTLVVDAIESVLEQEPEDWRLYILDDGCGERTRAAIAGAIGDRPTLVVDGFDWRHALDERIVWWKGPERSVEARRATIPYSYTINLAMNFLLDEEPYISFVCDDDYLLPGSLAGRADFLDQHRDVMVCFGRLRAVQFSPNGPNTWEGMSPPKAGRRWVEPTGQRIFNAAIPNAKHYYEGSTDPDTGLAYVEEGYWLPGPMRYGAPYRIDHNQAMIRRRVLDQRQWPFAERDIGRWPNTDHAIGRYLEYWCEDRRALAGDAAFFTLLSGWDFQGVDCWAVTKRYHALSDGVSDATVRE